MITRIKDFDPSAPRDYENGCPVCGRTDVVTERGLVLGHTCYPPFAEDAEQVLQERSVTFDGSGDHWAETASGLVVPAYAAPPELPIAVDLFAGAGGFSLGMHQGGFHVAAALEPGAEDLARCLHADHVTTSTAR